MTQTTIGNIYDPERTKMSFILLYLLGTPPLMKHLRRCCTSIAATFPFPFPFQSSFSSTRLNYVFCHLKKSENVLKIIIICKNIDILDSLYWKKKIIDPAQSIKGSQDSSIC